MISFLFTLKHLIWTKIMLSRCKDLNFFQLYSTTMCFIHPSKKSKSALNNLIKNESSLLTKCPFSFILLRIFSFFVLFCFSLFISDLLFGFLSFRRVCNAICGVESVDASDLPGPSVSSSCCMAPSVTDVFFKTLWFQTEMPAKVGFLLS